MLPSSDPKEQTPSMMVFPSEVSSQCEIVYFDLYLCLVKGFLFPIIKTHTPLTVLPSFCSSKLKLILAGIVPLSKTVSPWKIPLTVTLLRGKSLFLLQDCVPMMPARARIMIRRAGKAIPESLNLDFFIGFTFWDLMIFDSWFLNIIISQRTFP
jgi:hypothetical protein